MNQTVFNIMFYGAFILTGAGFIFIIAMMFSPKLRGKMMSKQVKSVRYMVDESKDDIHNISSDMADATKDGIRTTVSAIREGIKGEQTNYCKHCGASIDADSKFCKSCGKEQ